MIQEENNYAGEEISLQKPRIFVNDITFNDDTQISLDHNSIVAFTGPNNCGKSQVLKDIDHWFQKQWPIPPKVISQISDEYIGAISEDFLKARFYKNADGSMVCYEAPGNSFKKQNVVDFWQNKSLMYNLHKIFVKLINTEQRLITSNALQRNNDPKSHPIYKMCDSAILSQKISTYFRQAFGEDIVANRDDITTIPLHVGIAPDKDAYTVANQNEYYKEVEKLPRLDEQGDGMRSFVSIMLDTFISENTITLIDEPEAFLHPPQARLLGKMLAKNNPCERQLFVSTHSEDFLQGLLDADNDNVTVIRINRRSDKNNMSVLNNSEIRELWNNPILRYSNILSGLFHEKVVVCESDYDCLFYQAIMDAMCESRGEIAADILFTHCGGKGRMKDVVKALKAIDVPVVAIPDFDIIDNSHEFRQAATAFGIDWEKQLATPMKTVYDWLNSDSRRKEDIKKSGKAALNGEAYPDYEAVENICMQYGLFIVPSGEIESFDKSLVVQKRNWVFAVLERGNLNSEKHLDGARSFVQSIVEF